MALFAHALVKAKKVMAHHLPSSEVLSALSSGAHEALLRTHLGEAYDDLASAAKSVAALASGKKKRRVFILPGIMASLIGTPKGSDNHVKWLDPTEIAAGSLFHLDCSKTPITGTQVGPLLPCYLALKLRLELARHEVEIVAYDWRHKLEDIGAILASQIVADPAAKVTLVCHSMGGMVARAALAGSAAANAKVDLVVQMGTPNLGAPALSQAIRGTYPAVSRLAAIDVRHTPDDYGQLCNTFPGVFALVPPKGAAVFGVDLRDPSVWPKSGVQPARNLLSSCGYSQDTLFKPDARFHLIVGANLETVTGVQKQGDNFLYQYGYAGDGTVPHASSIIAGIGKIYYADQIAHTNLCIDPGPCDAAADILEGKTPSLPTTFTPSKAGVTKTETDASLLKANKLLQLEGDASHLFSALHADAAHAEQTVHATLKKAGSWLKKHHV